LREGLKIDIFIEILGKTSLLIHSMLALQN